MVKKRNHLGIFIKTGQENICIICGNKFYVKNCHKYRRFCSKECYWKNLIGKKQTKKHIENARLTRIGKKRSEETKKKIGLANSGANNGSWRGGISKTRKRQFSQIKYRLWRKEVFERDNYTCQECKLRGGYLEAHHIKPFAYFPNLQFDIKNGQTLCRKCHLEKTKLERKINWSNQFIKRKPTLSFFT